MKFSRLIIGGFVAVLMMVTSSCSLDKDAADQGFGPGSAGVPQFGSSALDLQLEAEKYRIFLESERSKPIYDSMKLAWDRFLHDNPGVKKNNSPFPMCDPLQYAGATKLIGPEGGDISVGPHKLIIPRGALTETTVVTAEMPVDTLVSVELSPHGLTFQKPVTLELSYKHCFLPKTYFYRMAYVDDNNEIIDFPLAIDQKKKGEVTGWLWHFSRYAVAY